MEEHITTEKLNNEAVKLIIEHQSHLRNYLTVDMEHKHYYLIRMQIIVNKLSKHMCMETMSELRRQARKYAFSIGKIRET